MLAAEAGWFVSGHAMSAPNQQNAEISPSMVIVEDLPAGTQRLGGPSLVYPPEMLARGAWGSTDVECKIDTAGRTSQCIIVSSDGGDAFVRAVLAFVASGQYNPAKKKGMPIDGTHHFHIDFKAPGPKRVAGPTLTYPAQALARGLEGWADIQCELDDVGRPNGCSVIGQDGGHGFAASALDYVASGRYEPLLRDGSAVSDPERRFHIEFKLPD
jgi:TonB family protein